MHSGALRLRRRGDGEIVDITEGVVRVLAASEVDRGVVTVFAVGSTVAVTTMEYEPGGVADLRALLDRLIPADANYEHNRRNHDTNALRAPARGGDRAVGVDPRDRRASGARNLAADRAAGLRRPATRPHRRSSMFYLDPPLSARPAPARPREKSIRDEHRIRALYSAVCPKIGWSGRGALRRERPSRGGAAVFENSTACTLFDRTSIENCVSRFDAVASARTPHGVRVRRRRCQD